MSTQQRVKIGNKRVDGNIEYTLIASVFPNRGGAVVYIDSNEVRRCQTFTVSFAIEIEHRCNRCCVSYETAAEVQAFRNYAGVLTLVKNPKEVDLA